MVIKLVQGRQLELVEDSSSTTVACGAKAPAKNTSKQYAAAPAMTIDTSKTYTAVMDTSCGTIAITLDAASRRRRR